ncbi:hypothetical protein [Moorena producens]|uniref:hypothetical protein n=1 Tax=Moorena producens TaxID=1155739 RepID=UPI000300415F|nr:hypothetical protein [Moorena producens]NEP68496.1 hypothetical protein [Moorena sp. SIO3A5]
MRLTLAKRPRYGNGHAGRDARYEPLRERIYGLGYTPNHSSAVLPKNLKFYP